MPFQPYTYTCAECGSKEIQIGMLVDVNTQEICTEMDNPPWCCMCEDWTALKAHTQCFGCNAPVPLEEAEMPPTEHPEEYQCSTCETR